MQKKAEGRVLGPYREGNKWRIVVIHASGLRATRTYGSKDKAQKAIPRALVQVQVQLHLGPQLTIYEEELALRGLSPKTVAETMAFLRAMFDGEQAGMWTSARVAATLELWQAAWAVPTRRLRLWQAQRFWGWLVARGKVGSNPFGGLLIPGRANRGKPQLRIDEARQLCRTAVAEYEGGKLLAVAPIVMLAMGLRSAEILGRRVRDVDDGGRVLWIPAGKTVNARRTLDVPPELQPLLVDLTHGREPDAYALGLNSRGKPWRHADLWEYLHGLCDRAGVPRVCPHSLRGLWASLAVRSGAACAAVAAALGHASFAITAAHYARPEAVDAARSANASQLLFPKPSA